METFVGDTIDIILETRIDISPYSVTRMIYVKPDGSTGFWASGVDPGDHTRMVYTTGPADIDIKGTWRIQAYISHGVERLHGKWAEFKVYPELPIYQVH